MNNKHLHEKDFFDLYYSTVDTAPLDLHLSECKMCSKRYDKFKADADIVTTDIYSADINALDDTFLLRQKSTIINAVRSDETERAAAWPLIRMMPITAALTVLLLFLLVSVVDYGTIKNIDSNQYAMSAQDLEDDALLMEIEHLIDEPDMNGLGIFVDLNGTADEAGIGEHGSIITGDTRKT